MSYTLIGTSYRTGHVTQHLGVRVLEGAQALVFAGPTETLLDTIAYLWAPKQLLVVVSLMTDDQVQVLDMRRNVVYVPPFDNQAGRLGTTCSSEELAYFGFPASKVLHSLKAIQDLCKFKPMELL